MQQVICTPSQHGSDVRCAICGQGFLVYWSRCTRQEQDECRRMLQQQLRNHHNNTKSFANSTSIHPEGEFKVIDWARVESISAAAAELIETAA